jgi:hypothetical protein
MPPPSPPPSRFQFSIGHILWATFVCAVLAAIARAMKWPFGIQVPLLLLMMVYALYAIFRLPYVLGDLRGRSAAWHRIQQQRAELQQFTNDRRGSAGAKQSLGPDAEPPRPKGP